MVAVRTVSTSLLMIASHCDDDNDDDDNDDDDNDDDGEDAYILVYTPTYNVMVMVR
jgi:hypothetical protein